MAQKLNRADIRRFSYEAKALPNGGWSRDVRWDSEVSGLGMRLYPGGKGAFVFSYRANGRKRLMEANEETTLAMLNAYRRFIDEPIAEREQTLRSPDLLLW